ncbi:hypothetical protein FKW77_008805 [Venturia effusa]|uniref:Uncharacterized protein n=1 Tax=Venturia effusa TaxID=50376 RepID=A0A517LBH0_9PEZI|nr:hypothetical protein FKW77_008805 [Venturia effusa]
MEKTGASRRSKKPGQLYSAALHENSQPAAIPEPARWNNLIPRLSPLLGSEDGTPIIPRNEPLDQATIRTRDGEARSHVKAMRKGELLPLTARDINLALIVNPQLPPPEQIRPPTQGSDEYRQIQNAIAWSERRKCELLRVIPGDAVQHQPTNQEELDFLRRHSAKRFPYYQRTTGQTDGIHPERVFNGLLDDAEWADTTLGDMQHGPHHPPYTMADVTGKAIRLGGAQALTAQSRAYFGEFRTGNAGKMRRCFYPASHHTEIVGPGDTDVVVVIQGQAFKVWRAGEVMDGYRKESSVDWVDVGATMSSGDSLLWEDDATFEEMGRVEGSGTEWRASNEGNEEAFEGFMKDVDLTRERYVHHSFSKYRERNLEEEREEKEAREARKYGGYSW